MGDQCRGCNKKVTHYCFTANFHEIPCMLLYTWKHVECYHKYHSCIIKFMRKRCYTTHAHDSPPCKFKRDQYKNHTEFLFGKRWYGEMMKAYYKTSSIFIGLTCCQISHEGGHTRSKKKCQYQSHAHVKAQGKPTIIIMHTVVNSIS